jgi:hypothetical protein
MVRAEEVRRELCGVGRCLGPGVGTRFAPTDVGDYNELAGDDARSYIVAK